MESPDNGGSKCEFDMVKRYVLSVMALFIGALLLLWAGDYAQVRVKLRRGSAFDSVTVRRFYAVPQKNGRIEFLSAEPQPQRCTHSLFPQMGSPPCWYLVRHAEQRIDM
ncbi:MAG: hypothetical protein JO065_18535 [Acidobacteria bacterium]|nr:hypothetical protein [Acidobacteriota bacterium]